MEEAFKLKCRMCGRSLNSNEAEVHDNKIVCPECNKKSPISVKQDKVVKMPPKRKTEGKLQFLCSKCNYKFFRNVDAKKLPCPYCGIGGFIIDYKELGSAEKLLNEDDSYQDNKFFKED